MSSVPKSTDNSERNVKKKNRFPGLVVYPSWLNWLLFSYAVASFGAVILGAIADGLAQTPLNSCDGLCVSGIDGKNGTDGILGGNGTAGANATVSVAPTVTLPAGDNASVSNLGNSTDPSFQFSIPRCRATAYIVRSLATGGQQVGNPSVPFQTFNTITVTEPGTYYVMWEGTIIETDYVTPDPTFYTYISLQDYTGTICSFSASTQAGTQAANALPFLDFRTYSIICSYTLPSSPIVINAKWITSGFSLTIPNITMSSNSITVFRIGP
jgi:hypothetical protein